MFRWGCKVVGSDGYFYISLVFRKFRYQGFMIMAVPYLALLLRNHER